MALLSQHKEGEQVNHKILTVVATVVLAATVALTGSEPASAARLAKVRPAVTLTMTRSVTAGAMVNGTYSAERDPRGAALFLQQQEGTRKVWRNIRKLRGVHGEVSLRNTGLGIWKYRVAVLYRRRLAASSRPSWVYAYGNVSLLTICDVASNEGFSVPLGCGAGDVQVGNMVYAYTGSQSYLDSYPTWDQSISFSAPSSCRSATFTFAGDSNDVVYMQMVQESLNAVTASTPVGVVGTMSVPLDGHPWILNVSGDPNNWGATIYMNGTFQCYTATGLQG